MFDVGISELAVIGVVALVVLGPERLPKVARTAGHLFGRLQRYVHTVKADINREIDASEFAKVKQEVSDAAKAFETTVASETSALEAEARKIQADAAKAVADPVSVPSSTVVPTQADILAKQTAGFEEPPVVAHTATSPNSAPVLASQPIANPAPRANSGQVFLDFGIEPVRTREKKS